MFELAQESASANTQLISLALATIVSIATVVSVVLTYMLARETRRSREALTEPHVVIYLDRGCTGVHFYDCVIRNVGNGPAYDVMFEILREDLLINGNESLKPLNLFKHGLRFIPPSFEHRFYFGGVLGQNSEKSADISSEIAVSYKSKDGTLRQETFTLDFRHLPGLTYLGTPPLEELARSARKIRETIERLASGDGLKVVNKTSSDLAKEYQEREDWRRRRHLWRPGDPEE